MKICPVCNDSFADELNFCDIDGARLAREGSTHEKNKWWSLLGAGLVVGALVITAASIFFLPKARLSTPVGSSEPQAVPVAPKPPAPAGDSASAVAAASAEPESSPADSLVPEVKKRDKSLANNNVNGPPPNPKAAALAAENADKRPQPADSNSPATAPPVNPEPQPAVKSVSDTRSAESNKSQPPPELRREPKPLPANAKASDKDSNDKKKNDDKNKKKSGGFLRVFKKIFGKD